jgi:hypothetical protein
MFKYDKENLFKEFYVAKEKDMKLSKKETDEEKENDVFTNRIQFLKDHIELKRKNPSYYSEVDINFDNLLKVYQTENPRDSFYMTIFGQTYLQKKREEEAEVEYLGTADAI